MSWRLNFVLALCISMAPSPSRSFLPSPVSKFFNFNTKSRRAAVIGLRASAYDSDLNRLQTALNNAIEGEDYQRAAEIRNRISQVTGNKGKPDGGWVRIGAPEWLADRAERLGFRMPAQVQRNVMCTVKENSDIVIRSPTGSGKTLAYMIPLLSGLSDDMLDEDLSIYLSRHLGSDANKGQQISRQLRDELPKTPLAVIVVPTRELGVQVRTCMFEPRLFAAIIRLVVLLLKCYY
jgi:superfamily II DNA/RNA helicase